MSGGYAAVEWLGSGSYGTVWSATKEDGTSIAVKKICDVGSGVVIAKRTLREAKLLRMLNHDNIVNVDQVSLSSNCKDIYIISELMDSSLASIIKSPQTLFSEHCQFFLYQILRGLVYIHTCNVIHRDLKPANLLVNKDCQLKICDFGLARLDATWLRGRCCKMTDYVATRWYRAPEVMLGWDEYSKAIDMWSVGCILAELLLRKPLFPSDTTKSHIQAVFYYLGGLSAEAQSHIVDPQVRHYVSRYPLEPTEQLETLFPVDVNPQAIDLLQKMLVVDPAGRINVWDALRHPYLSKLHLEEDEPIGAPLSEAEFLFDMQGADYSVESLLEELKSEAALYQHDPLPNMPTKPKVASGDEDDDMCCEASGEGKGEDVTSSAERRREAQSLSSLTRQLVEEYDTDDERGKHVLTACDDDEDTAGEDDWMVCNSDDVGSKKVDE